MRFRYVWLIIKNLESKTSDIRILTNLLIRFVRYTSVRIEYNHINLFAYIKCLLKGLVLSLPVKRQ